MIIVSGRYDDQVNVHCVFRSKEVCRPMLLLIAVSIDMR